MIEGFETEPLTLQEWLVQTEDLRGKLYAFAKSPLPIEAGPRHLDMDVAIQNADDAGRMVADVDSFLAQFTAKAVLDVKKAYPDNSADERKLLVKNEVQQLQLLRDGLAVTVRTIRDRIYVGMNENRARA